MTDTNIHLHPDNVQIGPAVLALWDEVNDHLVNIGKIDDIVLGKNVEMKFLTEFISGVEHRVEGRPVSENWTLKGKFAETLNPNTQRLFFKNCGTPTVDPGCILQTITEKVQMYRGVQQFLRGNIGFPGDIALPPPATVSGSVFGAGATIPTATYVVVVTAVYDGVEGDFAESAGIALNVGQNLVVAITAPAGVTPDKYRVYTYRSSLGETRLANAFLQIETSATTFFLTTRATASAYPGDATGSVVVTDVTGTITYTPSTDYTIDPTCAMVCLVDAGAVDDGQYILITYAVYRNPRVSMSLGPGDRIPKYVHPVILSFKDDDRVTPVGRGVEIHLYKVLADTGFEWNLSKMDWDTGWAFEWNCLVDPRRRKVGDVYTYHRQFTYYALDDLAGLTEFVNQVPCALPSS